MAKKDTSVSVTEKRKSNDVKKEIKLLSANLKALERKYLSSVTYKDGEWQISADSVMALENTTAFINESLSTFLEGVKAQAR
jgi:hypothetical protein